MLRARCVAENSEAIPSLSERYFSQSDVLYGASFRLLFVIS